jgi:hypothetical protein
MFEFLCFEVISVQFSAFRFDEVKHQIITAPVISDDSKE